jgi:hypothetical protein
MEVVMGASAQTTRSLKVYALVVSRFVDDGSGKAKHEFSYYHSVVSNGHYGSLKEETCCFASAGR